MSTDLHSNISQNGLLCPPLCVRCVPVCTHPYECRDQRKMLGVLHQPLSIPTRQHLPGPGACFICLFVCLARLASNKPQGCSCLCHLPRVGVIGVHSHTQLFTWMLRSKLRSSGFCLKRFYPLSYLPSPRSSFS